MQAETGGTDFVSLDQLQLYASQHTGSWRRPKHTSRTRGSSSPTSTNPGPGPTHFQFLLSRAEPLKPRRTQSVTRSAQQRGTSADSQKNRLSWMAEDSRGPGGSRVDGSAETDVESRCDEARKHDDDHHQTIVAAGTSSTCD